MNENMMEQAKRLLRESEEIIAEHILFIQGLRADNEMYYGALGLLDACQSNFQFYQDRVNQLRAAGMDSAEP